MSDVQVSRNEQESRYEAHLDGALAGYADYRLGDGTVEFPHTVTESEYEGRGVASALARTSLDEARAEGRRVIPTCPFYAGWIDKHPEYADLVDG